MTDTKLIVKIDDMKSKWDGLPSDKVLNETIDNVKSRGINVVLVESKAEALDKIKKIIPKGSGVATGSSTTLHEIGFTDYLKSSSEWNNLAGAVVNETDNAKKDDMRRKNDTADYFLGSVNAISKNGELVAVDASGSRVGAYPFAAKHLILVSGVNKIVQSLEDAMKRVREHVFPLENERAKKTYGMGSAFGKWVIIEREFKKDRITLILIKEKLGF